MRSLSEEQRRARSAALGVGTAFVGAAIVAAPRLPILAVPLLLAGIALMARMLRRGVAEPRAAGAAGTAGTAAAASPDRGIRFALDDIATTLADLHREAEATEGVLQRVRARQ